MSVNGVGQSLSSHLIKHAADAFAQLLAITHVCTDPGYVGIAGVPHHVGWVYAVGKARGSETGRAYLPDRRNRTPIAALHAARVPIRPSASTRPRGSSTTGMRSP